MRRSDVNAIVLFVWFGMIGLVVTVYATVKQVDDFYRSNETRVSSHRIQDEASNARHLIKASAITPIASAKKIEQD